MLFDGRPELPIATLQPAVRGRRMRADLRRWIDARRAWLRPRLVPLMVACVGLFATLGAAKGVLAYSYEPLRLPVRSTVWSAAPYHHDHELWRPQHGRYDGPPVRLLIRPLAPNDPYVELTIGNRISR